MDTFHATRIDDWRDWLTEHGRTATEVWLVIQHKDSPRPSPRYHEVVEHALCFGWIDGLHRRHDEHSSRLRFTPRRAGSVWSALNRDRAARMTAAGLMTRAGQASVDAAKAAGVWELTEPADLTAALDRTPSARRNFDAFPPSSRNLILAWITAARKPATRDARITRTAELAAVNLRAG